MCVATSVSDKSYLLNGNTYLEVFQQIAKAEVAFDGELVPAL